MAPVDAPVIAIVAELGFESRCAYYDFTSTLTVSPAICAHDAAASRWLQRLKAVGALTTWHKLEPTKIGERFVKDAGADFVCCTSSGSYIAIECKATDQDRFKRSEVSQVQTEHLDSVPLSFLALRIGDEMFFVPWRAIPWETLRTAESVTAARLSAWKVSTWMGVREWLCLSDGK